MQFTKIEKWSSNKMGPGEKLVGNEISLLSLVKKLDYNKNSKKVIDAITQNTRARLGSEAPHSEVMKSVKGYRRTLKNMITEIRSSPPAFEISTRYVSHEVVYKQNAKFGRMQAEGNLSLAMISRPIRATLAEGIYDDYDIKNCHPEFVINYIKLYPEYLSKATCLERYINKREEVFEELENDLGWTKEKSKTEILRILNGGMSLEEYDRIKNESPFMKEYYGQARRMLSEFYENLTNHSDFKCLKFKEPKRSTNYEGKTISRFLQYQENNTLFEINKEITALGYTTGVLCFDGLLIQRKYFPNEDSFDSNPAISYEEVEKIAKKVGKITNFPIKIVRKPMMAPIQLPKTLDKPKIPSDQIFIEDFISLPEIRNSIKIIGNEVFYWNEEKRFWRRTNSEMEIGGYVSEKLQEYYNAIIEDVEALEAHSETLQSGAKWQRLGKMIVTKEFLREDESYILNFNRSFNYLIPIKGGNVIDLKTKEVKQREKEHFFTYETSRIYLEELSEEKRKDIDDFFKEFMMYMDKDGIKKLDEEQFLSFKKAIGYSLTGSVKKKHFYLCLGETDSGKSTLFKVLASTFECKNLLTSISPNLICDGSIGGIKSEHQALETGARLASCSEFEEGMVVTKSGLKRLTGDDVVTFRPFGNKSRDYTCVAKIWLHTNDCPKMDITDPALMRRFIAFHFKNDFSNSTKEQEKSLERIYNLKDEVFTYLCEAAYDFYEGGENIPITKAMEGLKNEIISEMDPLTDFKNLYEISLSEQELEDIKIKEIQEMVESNSMYISDTLWSEYISYCNGKDSKPGYKKKSFEMRIVSLFGMNKKHEVKIGGKRYSRVFAYKKKIEQKDENFFETFLG